MRDRIPTVRSRELGHGLRLAIRGAGLNASKVARQLGWSASRVSRMMSGKRGGSPLDVAAILAICKVVGEERDRLIALSYEREIPNWFQLPTQLRTLINHECQATSIITFESTLIPGLLQTDSYARAVIEGVGTVPEDGIEDRIEARRKRQLLLSLPQSPACTFFIHEFALLLSAGSAAIMSEQLHHLLMMSVRWNITVRVLPCARGVHAAVSGSFRFMEFVVFPPVVYLETETSSVFLETESEIEAYRAILAKLDETALDAGQSRDLIASVAVELYADGDGHGAPGGPGMA